MIIYFLGCEQNYWTTRLLGWGVSSLGLSYSGLARRAAGHPRKSLSERFPDTHKLLLDSGGFLANHNPDTRSRSEWEQYAREYAAFAMANAERCDLITEFDFLAMGPDWIDEMRRGVWRELGEKFLPVWHPEQGLAALDATADRFGRVAIVGETMAEPGQSLNGRLARLARRGIELHGLALTKPEAVHNIPFASVASTSWLYPQKNGEIQVWDGRTMHRYPAKHADQGRKRHRNWIAQNGFDLDAWDAGETETLLSVAVWSWLRWSEHATARHGMRVVPDVNNIETELEGSDSALVSTLPVVHSPNRAPRQRELVPLPLFGFKDAPAEEGEEPTQVPVLTEGSLRACDTCFLANNDCPGYESGSACKYQFPARVETKAQRKAVANGALEMQFQRVQFMYMNEQLSGGYADPNLSKELDRLFAMMDTQARIEDDRDYFEMTVRASTKQQGGLITQLLGRDIAQRSQRLDRVLGEAETDRMIEDEFTRHDS